MSCTDHDSEQASPPSASSEGCRKHSGRCEEEVRARLRARLEQGDEPGPLRAIVPVRALVMPGPAILDPPSSVSKRRGLPTALRTVRRRDDYPSVVDDDWSPFPKRRLMLPLIISPRVKAPELRKLSRSYALVQTSLHSATSRNSVSQVTSRSG